MEIYMAFSIASIIILLASLIITIGTILDVKSIRMEQRKRYDKS